MSRWALREVGGKRARGETSREGRVGGGRGAETRGGPNWEERGGRVAALGKTGETGDAPELVRGKVRALGEIVGGDGDRLHATTRRARLVAVKVTRPALRPQRICAGGGMQREGGVR